MDCGPAALKCLLEGFRIHVSYDRLREACQTGIDGTSIDTMERVANQLGLEAEQVMLPVDHLLLGESKALPAIVIVKLPNGLTHFVVAWRLHGRIVQVMDPATGRRWTGYRQFTNEVFCHTMMVPAEGWREFASSAEFQAALTERLSHIGIRSRDIQSLASQALEQPRWQALGALDAATRLVTALIDSHGLKGSESARLIARLVETAELIPDAYWSVRRGPDDTDGQAQVLMRGAVLVRIRAGRVSPVSAIPAEAPNLTPELAAAVAERPVSPGLELFRIVCESGLLGPSAITAALALAACATVIEALLFRTLFDVTADLKLVGQRAAAIAALLLFSLTVLLLELPISSGVLRIGRQIENRLRLAFLRKIPKLGDRYFQSRLTSDMAERSHVTHRLRNLPELTRQLMRAGFGLCATAAGIIWLAPAATPLVVFAVAAALLPAFMVQSLLTERDLRVRSHAAALTRFYLDAMLGLVAIRAHSAERSLRGEHERLLGAWGDAALRLQRAVVSVEAVQLTAIFGLVAWLILSHSIQGTGAGSVLLVVYWALNLPLFGQEIAAVTRQSPHYRNLTLRLLEPLGAPEEPTPEKMGEPLDRAPSLEFQQVSVEVSGHRILNGINLQVAPGAHIAIVGPSGAGKSSLVGILLGWFKPCAGNVLVNGLPLDCDQLRRSMAWVDPAVQLWNRSFFANLVYGAGQEALAVGRTIDAALLRSVLEAMPQGLQTKLGEGGALVSGGEGQRVRLGRAMLHTHARLVVLDEPFRGLDREKRRELLRRAREYWRGSTLLCITHDLEETQQFDRVLVIEKGQIAEEGEPGELCGSANSRYLELLEAEREMRSGLWASRMWRRIHVHSGRIVEQHPEPVHDQERESEVA